MDIQAVFNYFTILSKRGIPCFFIASTNSVMKGGRDYT